MRKVTRKYIAAGVSHYMDSIDALAHENADYELSKKGLIDGGHEGEKVYKKVFFPESVVLEPDPSNPYDANAVKVVVDGFHVGYIKKGSAAHIKKQLEAGNIVNVSADIGGGPWKLVTEDEDDGCTLEKGEYNYWVNLRITEMVDGNEPSENPCANANKAAYNDAGESKNPINDKERRIKMFCRNCGKEIDDGTKFCPNCGANTGTGTEQVKSQYQQPVINVVNTNTNVNSFGYEHKSKWVAFFLCLFLGEFGAHRFYVRKTGTGIIWLLTLGFFGIGWILDLIFILLGGFRDKAGQKLI